MKELKEYEIQVSQLVSYTTTIFTDDIDRAIDDLQTVLETTKDILKFAEKVSTSTKIENIEEIS